MKNLNAYAQPPLPGEGTWIINEFLNATFGSSGGRLFAGAAVKFPEYADIHVKTVLETFINSAKYQHYPFRQEWNAHLAADRAGTNTIRANVVFCRDITRNQKVNKRGGYDERGKPIIHGGYIWHIGPRKEGW